jgi:hypothetical protein
LTAAETLEVLHKDLPRLFSAGISVTHVTAKQVSDLLGIRAALPGKRIRHGRGRKTNKIYNLKLDGDGALAKDLYGWPINS